MLFISYFTQNNWLTVSLYANSKKKVRESELKLKCLHLSLALSFTFAWNLSRKMSRKTRLTGNGNLTFAVCVNGNLNLSNVFDWFATTFWHLFDNFLLASVASDQSKCKGCERRSCH